MVKRDVAVILRREEILPQEIRRNLRTTNPCPLQCESELKGRRSFVLGDIGTGPCKKHGASCCSRDGFFSLVRTEPRLGRCHRFHLIRLAKKTEVSDIYAGTSWVPAFTGMSG